MLRDPFLGAGGKGSVQDPSPDWADSQTQQLHPFLNPFKGSLIPLSPPGNTRTW